MSMFQNLLGLGIRGLGRTAEKGATWWVEKAYRPLRRALLIGGAAFSTSSLLGHYYLNWGIAAGVSMYPTMPSHEHYVFLDATKRRGKNVELGDCVQVLNPIFKEELAGKRILGMPGDYIVRDPYLAPSVGGAPMPGITDWRSDEEIAKGVELKERTEPEMIEVPEGHVWLVGDNLSGSRDSRFYGAVPMALIKGKSFAISENLFSYTSLKSSGLKRIPKEEEEAYLRGYSARGDDSEG